MSGSFHKQNPLNNYYRGPVRQRGSGIGSLALKVARHALPLLSKYVLPSAKRVGKDIALNLLPEVFDVVTGRGGEPATTSSSIKKAVKRATGKTIRKQLGTGAAKKKRRQQSVGKSSKTKTVAQQKRAAKNQQEAKQQQQKRLKNAKRLTFFKICFDGQ